MAVVRQRPNRLQRVLVLYFHQLIRLLPIRKNRKDFFPICDLFHQRSNQLWIASLLRNSTVIVFWLRFRLRLSNCPGGRGVVFILGSRSVRGMGSIDSSRQGGVVGKLLVGLDLAKQVVFVGSDDIGLVHGGVKGGV